MVRLSRCNYVFLSLTIFIFNVNTFFVNFNVTDKNSLTGTIPSEIGNMSNLSILHLCKFFNMWLNPFCISTAFLTLLLFIFDVIDDNSFTGTVPSVFGNMSNLKMLYLRKFCAKSGSHSHLFYFSLLILLLGCNIQCTR